MSNMDFTLAFALTELEGRVNDAKEAQEIAQVHLFNVSKALEKIKLLVKNGNYYNRIDEGQSSPTSEERKHVPAQV